MLIPWYLYEATGDLSFLSENYQAMKDYMAYVEREAVIDHIQGHPDLKDWHGYGDWLALDGSKDPFGNTPKELIGTAFHAHNADLLAQIAEVLDKPDDVPHWESLHTETRKAFQNRFLSPEGIPTGGTQTSCILALHFNLVTEAQRPGCVKELVRLIQAGGPKIGTGFVGTPYILQVLEDNGHLDLAYQLLEREEFPSWLFPVVHGATTIWERWDGWHTERGHQSKSMNSYNHYAYGAVGEWMVRSVAGITPEEPAYRVIRFKPRPGGSLLQAEASLELPGGRVAISWNKTDAGLQLDLQVPEGHTALLDLPGQDPETLQAGLHQRTV